VKPGSSLGKPPQQGVNVHRELLANIGDCFCGPVETTGAGKAPHLQRVRDHQGRVNSGSTKGGVEARRRRKGNKPCKGRKTTGACLCLLVLVGKSVETTYSTCNIRLILARSMISSFQNYTIPFTNILSSLQYSGTIAA